MLVFSSDWHLSNKHPIRTITILNFMNYLDRYMSDNNINTFVFGGDLIDHNNKISYDVFAPVFKKFYEWKQKGRNNVYIVGNHDMINSAESLLEILEPLGKVILKPTTLELDGTEYDCVPYTQDVNDLPRKASFLLSHLDVESFYYNPHRVCDSAPFTTEILNESYEMSILGHFHYKNAKNGVIYPGAPIQMDFSNEGQETYFAVVGPGMVEMPEYTEAPTHLTIDLENWQEYDYTNKYVKVKISSKLENYTKLKSLLYSKGALDVIPLFIREESPQDATSHTINTSDSIVVSAAKYLADVKADGIDNDKLLKYFKEVLKELK